LASRYLTSSALGTVARESGFTEIVVLMAGPGLNRVWCQ
jgi:hypothetical protein